MYYVSNTLYIYAGGGNITPIQKLSHKNGSLLINLDQRMPIEIEL